MQIGWLHPIVLVAGAMLSFAASSETLHNVGWNETLGEVKAKYPNASFTSVKAAWVTKDQAFYEMKGSGFPGKLMMAFDDMRPFYRGMAKDSNCDAAEPPAMCKGIRELAEAADTDALSISWVRWVPEIPIPLTRYKARYGEPSTVGFAPSDMAPFAEWEAKGLWAQLSDDKTMVLFIETAFTKADKRAYFISRGRPVPPSLQEQDNARPPVSKGKKATL